MEGVLASETLFRSLIQPAINENASQTPAHTPALVISNLRATSFSHRVGRLRYVLLIGFAFRIPWSCFGAS